MRELEFLWRNKIYEGTIPFCIQYENYNILIGITTFYMKIVTLKRIKKIQSENKKIQLETATFKMRLVRNSLEL